MAGCCAPSPGDRPAGDLVPGSAARAARVTAEAAAGGDLLALPGAAFMMGTEDGDGFPADGEGPVREVVLEPFRIAAHAVTNDQFGAFVAATGHVSEAERFGWSYVFAGFLPGPLRARSPRPEQTPWWCAVRGARWDSPEGPGSDLDGRGDHPAVHVSWNDAQAYCGWAGVRLPAEAEWEYAARGGLEQARYPWGDDLTPGGQYRANTWQGRFPTTNTADDGYAGTAPVGAFEPNGYGLYNASGNVWEWCADAWSVGGRAAPGPQDARVMRGGSYLCHASYCNRYRVAARTSNTADSTSGNQGFRVAADEG